MTIEQWRERAAEERERARQLASRLPQPYRRERPRDADEARLLRERGTPEHLIGPEKPADPG